MTTPKYMGIESPSHSSFQFMKTKATIKTPTQMSNGKKLWLLAKKKVSVIAKINAMKRVTLQNYYGVRDGNEFEEIEQVNKWVLLPESRFKQLWEAIVTTLMLYTATILPFRLSFFDDSTGGWDTFDQVCNYFFMVDIVVNAFSAYYDQDNVLITNNLQIFKNYLRGWFWIDVVSVIPISDILLNSQQQQQSGTQTNGNKSKSYNSLVRLARLPRLYKLVRVLRLLKLTKLKDQNKTTFLGKLFKPFLKMDASIKRMFKIMALSLLFLHLSSCFYFLIAKLEDTQVTWVSNLQLEQADAGTQYIRAMYWSLQTLTTVGFGDVPPQTNWEKLYAIVWMGVGSAFFSFMISNLQGTVNDTGNTVKSKVTKLEQLNKELSLPDEIYRSIKRHIESQSIESNRAHIIQQTKPLIKQLPTCLRSSVLLCIYAHVIEKIKFLQDKDIELIMAVIPKISALNWVQGDILYTTDDYAEEVFFISVGEISIRAADGSTISIYRDGDSLGLLEVIYDVRRIGTAIASKNSQLYSLDRTTYLQMLWAYPQLLSEVKQQVDKRITEIRPFVEDSTILNRSIYEVIQDYKRKTNKIDRIMEQLQKSEQSDFETEILGSQVQSFLSKHECYTSLFKVPEKDAISLDKVVFENTRQMNLLIDQLADIWQKELIQGIDTMHKESAAIVLEVQQRVDYYQRATKKVIYQLYDQFSNMKSQFQKTKQKLQKSLKT